MCDLTDPSIVQAYTEIIENEPVNWLILGYHDTRDVLSLYSKGTGGLSEFRQHLNDEVLYGFIRLEDRFILITWISNLVSGVRRARALVHSRSVASLFKLHQAQITATSINEVSDANIRTRLKLDDSNSRRSSLSQKRSSSRRSSTIDDGPSPPVSPPPVPPTHQSFTAEPEQIQEQDQRLTKENEEAQKIAREEAQRLAKENEQAQMLAKEEAQRLAREREEAQRLARERDEAQRLAREKEEAQRRADEKIRMLQNQVLNADKDKDTLLTGYASIQSSTNPFWRRRYFILKGKSLAFYNDELQAKQPVLVLDLNNVKRLSHANVDIETFIPNAFVLETQLNGSFQLFTDNKAELQTMLTILQTIKK